MRTTLTIDDDNAVRLERLRKERDASLKDVVNEAIRRGLNAMAEPPLTRVPFKTGVYDPGKPFFPVDNIGDVLEMLDEADFKEKSRK
ncbi:MAG: ribbon-helix-helix domain-containing protein [Rhizomicrobium sp.]|jgi:hypothetical protein